ncbi:protein-L-isoaspartate(D-aspartate) O-methyltransferase [Mariprofundus ferrinatatus]|uniref:Protein-L-isoaspartate O-methyltransferase n=1 Tax=Mariprofundus ferrinatatus TaxID=1921087 RepID=A0A2K8L6M0_9PROT|nr:protein-L-isoaspartate(D-aspartate) O-methyltransferase [Mariprofundus ferrinatatus]ATX81899.1 protein-L-isoaspartate(D-aspartate) O-methyltransferase [Mariprofundus ferrinatatus]
MSLHAALSYERPRQRMVGEQIQARGIHDERVLAAMRTVPRHLFVDPALVSRAYQDASLPIGSGQTISQPYMVARMTQLLELQGHERVLEIGTGCGYQTAVLSRLCRRVYSIERIAPLHERARQNLRAARHANVMLKCADGRLGWEEYAPYDAIIVTAGGFASELWLQQLKTGGMLLLPEGENGAHRLVRRTKLAHGINEEYFDACTFVPLLEGVESSLSRK